MGGICRLFSARYFILKNRLCLALAVVSIVLGYLTGLYYCSVFKVYSDTELSASSTVRLSAVEFWNEVEMKIDKIIDDVRELQAYVNTGRQTFRVTNTADR
ncbi:Uncharacterized protein FWK35_00038055 [Aphis craccivora]|uniref:Uncharacterized protein n=1 Tax=Aphis craccivora TaxID=307492 RepID=A0A6G0W5R4_APHCR|nr:Uncharacterized protein FWK35_00038055 [Aphis craccivora]